MTIAVDFDGTIVEHRYPQIGEEIPFATATLKMLINERHRLILWSVREGKLLEEAVEWPRGVIPSACGRFPCYFATGFQKFRCEATILLPVRGLGLGILPKIAVFCRRVPLSVE